MFLYSIQNNLADRRFCQVVRKITIKKSVISKLLPSLYLQNTWIFYRVDEFEIFFIIRAEGKIPF